MSAAFVPLFSADKVKKQARLASALTQDSGTAHGFVPFKRTGAGEPPLASSQGPSNPVPASPAAQHNPPTISVEKDGETVRQIRVKCGCGEVIELECGY